MNKQNTNLHDILYDALNIDEKPDNPFETDEINNPLSEFCEQYIYETAAKPDYADDGWSNLINIIEEAQRNAFKVGFETAVALLMKGGVHQ